MMTAIRGERNICHLRRPPVPAATTRWLTLKHKNIAISAGKLLHPEVAFAPSARGNRWLNSDAAAVATQCTDVAQPLLTCSRFVCPNGCNYGPST